MLSLTHTFHSQNPFVMYAEILFSLTCGLACVCYALGAYMFTCSIISIFKS